MSLIPADTVGGDVAYYHAAFAHQPPASVVNYRRLKGPMRETQAVALRQMETAAEAALAASGVRILSETATR